MNYLLETVPEDITSIEKKSVQQALYLLTGNPDYKNPQNVNKAKKNYRKFMLVVHPNKKTGDTELFQIIHIFYRIIEFVKKLSPENLNNKFIIKFQSLNFEKDYDNRTKKYTIILQKQHWVVL